MANVLVPLAQGCEELEAVTVIDLLRRAGVNVIVAGLEAGPVKGCRGTVLLPDVLLDDVLQENFDMMVLPGGLPGSDHLNKDARIHSLLNGLAANDKYIAAICAAPKVLATAGLLDGRRATSYPGSMDGIETRGMTYEQHAVVIDGRVITSRGPGTAMDFTLALIEQLLGKGKRDEVEASLQRPPATVKR